MHSKLTSIDLAKDDILKYLKDLKTNKACGPDEISTIVLKEAATERTMPLHIIFMKSFKSGIIPDDTRLNLIRFP